MLKFAIEYQEKLIAADIKTWLNPYFKYFNDAWNEKITVEDNDWNRIQMVSVDKQDNVIGYFKVDVNRAQNNLCGLVVANFASKCNPTFSKDFYHFLSYLFVDRGFHRLEWNVIIGNPIEKMYDKFCKKIGGNIIGVAHDATMLQNHQYADMKYYEVFGDGVKKYLNSQSGRRRHCMRPW